RKGHPPILLPSVHGRRECARRALWPAGPRRWARLASSMVQTDRGFRRMQDLRKISREYPFICPVDLKPHKGSPLGSDPNLDPTFIANHREDDGAHYLG